MGCSCSSAGISECYYLIGEVDVTCNCTCTIMSCEIDIISVGIHKNVFEVQVKLESCIIHIFFSLTREFLCRVAYSNIRFFITYGGLLNTQEAVIRLVPLLGIFVFGDQNVNKDRLWSYG
jgi:hypothetical protein